MRKIILLLIVCSSSQIFAQKSFFGVDAGVNVANHRYVTNPSAYSPGPGPVFFQNVVKPSIGIFYQFNFYEKVGIRVDAKYLGLGHKNRFDSRYDVNINYVTFPFSLCYYANKHLVLNAGPYLSFTINNTNVKNQASATIPVTSVYHKNDFGFIMGAEHDVYKNFALSVNYVIGTKNIWLDDQGGTIKYTNRALQFTLIYKFKKIQSNNN